MKLIVGLHAFYMKLIIGIGNPGEKYKNSRHNVGYVVVDKLIQNLKVKNQNYKSKFKIEKTNVYMNGSGEFVKHLISQYPNISISDLYIIHDDLDIPLGSYKIQFAKGPKVHRGIQSIEEALGTADFWRVRVGIENRNNELENTNQGKRVSGEEYVLQDFTKEERVIIDKVIDELVKEILKKAS